MQQPVEILTRLAPTPSGYLHRGNVFNFLLNWLYARKNSGRVMLRIDDLDAARMRPEYLSDIFRVLELFGLDWDLGPTGPADFLKNWSQNGRTNRYEAWLDCLREKGLVYACSCSRSALNQAGFSVHYPGICREKGLDFRLNETALRLNIDKLTNVCKELMLDRRFDLLGVNYTGNPGDPVVLRKDGIPAYHIATVSDDVQFDITHVFRGMDLLESTVIQRMLACAADETRFSSIIFGHHPLIIKESGEKLSKSAGGEGTGPIAINDEEIPSVLKEFADWSGLDLHGQIPQKAPDLLAFFQTDSLRLPKLR